MDDITEGPRGIGGGRERPRGIGGGRERPRGIGGGRGDRTREGELEGSGRKGLGRSIILAFLIYF